ncbi:hypothetical protein SLS57_002769 [Botryosphaeria dothidea]
MTVLFMKLSVATFYLRITVLRWQVWTVYVLMGINIIYTIAWSLGRRGREHGYIMSGHGHDLKSLKTEASTEPQTTNTVSAGLEFPGVRGTSDEELGILKQTEVDVTVHEQRRSRSRKASRSRG